MYLLEVHYLPKFKFFLIPSLEGTQLWRQRAIHEKYRHVAQYALFRLRPDLISGCKHHQEELQDQLRRDLQGRGDPARRNSKKSSLWF